MSRLFRVTFIAPTLKLTGGMIVAKRYADYLHSRGHEITVVGIHHDEGLFKDAPYSVRNIRLAHRPFWHHLLFDLLLIGRFLKTVPPSDFIITVFSPLLVHAILLKKHRSNRKVLHLYQDAKNIRYFGVYNRLLFRIPWVYRNIDMTMPITERLLTHYARRRNLPVTLLPNGIESDIFCANTDAPKKNRILFVGTKRKRLSTFLKVAKEHEAIDPDVEFMVVCPGTLKIRIPSNTVVIDVKGDRKRLSGLYQSAKLYVGLSRIESFGLTALEAMACGTPVITTKSDGVLGYCRDQFNCVFIRNQNPRNVAELISVLLRDPEKLSRLSSNGIETASRFQWANSFKKLSAILGDLS